MGGKSVNRELLRDCWRRALEKGHLSLWALCEGNLDGGSFTEGPEGYVENALETGISIHRGTAENLEGVSFTRVFERWVKGALEVGVPLSLWGSSVRGTWRGGDFNTGDPGRYVENAMETDISFHSGPTGEHGRGLVYQRRWKMKEGSRNGASLSGALWGEPGGGFFTGDPERYVKQCSRNERLLPHGPSFWGTRRDAFLAPSREWINLFI